MAWIVNKLGSVECANTECPNKPHEGSFVTLSTLSRTAVSGMRGITLVMCVPCASAATEPGEDGPVVTHGRGLLSWS